MRGTASLVSISILLSGCIGSTVLNEKKDQNLREFPTLHSIPPRPSVTETPSTEFQELEQSQTREMKKNKKLREKYGLPTHCHPRA